MKVEIIPCLNDNFSYLIYDKESDNVSIVDPAEYKACDNVIKKYKKLDFILNTHHHACLLYTSPSPRDLSTSRMPSSA